MNVDECIELLSTLKQPFLHGWEIFYKSISKTFLRKSDILISLVHWMLRLKNVKCFGMIEGKEFLKEMDEAKQPLDEYDLPSQWNKTDNYFLHYRAKDSSDFFLQGISVKPNFLVIRLGRRATQEYSFIYFNIDATVTWNINLRPESGTIESLIKMPEVVLARIRDELFDGIVNYQFGKEDVASQTTDHHSMQIIRMENQMP